MTGIMPHGACQYGGSPRDEACLEVRGRHQAPECPGVGVSGQGRARSLQLAGYACQQPPDLCLQLLRAFTIQRLHQPRDLDL